MADNLIVHPLPPIYDQESKVLILGSFPSIISREKNFYYANPNNRFWKVLENIFHEKIEDKEAFCLSHHIALWDVIHQCRITGSSDSSIKDVTVNDIQSIIDQTNIKVVFTTGRTATKLYEKYMKCSTLHIALPSTSSANAKMSLERLIDDYERIREYAESN